jgi:hypothetical protein
MSDPAAPAAEARQEPKLTFARFLEVAPPNARNLVSELVEFQNGHAGTQDPDINLHCTACGGVRVFECTSNHLYLSKQEWNFGFMHYRCRNCRKDYKTFSLVIRRDGQSRNGFAEKLGEIPTFGQPIPARVITLIGPDRDLFLQGRRAELQGLGIGAFVYYRRVIEHQKGRIIEQIAKVAMKIGAPESTLKLFEEAERETQFSTAIEKIKAAIPQALLIDGHNPLTLLHSATSEGVHEKTDEECLHLATSVRVVLTELSERLAQILKDEAELRQAVGQLLNRKNT